MSKKRGRKKTHLRNWQFNSMLACRLDCNLSNSISSAEISIILFTKATILNWDLLRSYVPKHTKPHTKQRSIKL